MTQRFEHIQHTEDGDVSMCSLNTELKDIPKETITMEQYKKLGGFPLYKKIESDHIKDRLSGADGAEEELIIPADTVQDES